MEAYTPTKFIESNALLSVQAGDDASAHAALAQLTDRELLDLRHACMALATMCQEWRGAGVDLDA